MPRNRRSRQINDNLGRAGLHGSDDEVRLLPQIRPRGANGVAGRCGEVKRGFNRWEFPIFAMVWRIEVSLAEFAGIHSDRVKAWNSGEFRYEMSRTSTRRL